MPKISDALRAERRRQVLDATAQCLMQLGYAGTNMRTIADAAGLTKGGLYAYFDSKEAILLAVAERYMVTQLASYAPRAGEPALAQLSRVLTTMEESAADAALEPIQRAIFDLWSFAGELPAVKAALLERYERYHSALAGMLGRAQGEGAIRPDADAGQIASLLMAARDGLLYQRVKLGAPIDVGSLSQLLRTILTKYLTGH